MLRRSFKLLAIASLANVPIAHASGSLPPFVEKSKFKSHADCLVSLRNDLQQDRNLTTNGRIGFGDGTTRQVTLITDGLVTKTRNITNYHSELWRVSGGPVERPGAPETAATPGAAKKPLMRYHSTYETRERICKGRIKTVAGQDGYTLDHFE